MGQNDNKNAARENKGFEQGKKPYTQKPDADEHQELPDRWEKQQPQGSPNSSQNDAGGSKGSRY